MSDSLPPPRRRKRKRSRAPKSDQQENDQPTKAAWRFPGRQFLKRLLFTVSERANERSPGWLAFVLVLSTSLAMHAVFRIGFIPGLFNGLTWINFIIHELGHLAFQFAPEWIYVAAGTFVQLALPFGAIFMFLRQRDDAAACFAVCWLAISLVHTAHYIADARATQLDMTMSAQFWSVTSGEAVRPEETGHDWEFLLNSVGLLNWDRVIGRCVHVLAGTIAVLAVFLNGWMFYSCLRSGSGQQRRRENSASPFD